MNKYINLDAETRNGYFISQKQKKIWNIELDLLHQLISICEKYNINIFCYAGTLLGAIRHKGFIPWDDDIDVALLRADFDKLVSHSNEFKAPYFFQTGLSDRKFFCGYARLRNSDTTGLIKGEESADYNNGIYIDIFVLDGYIGDNKTLKKQIDHRNHIVGMLSRYYAFSGKKPKKTYRYIIKKIYSFCIRKMFSYEQLYDKYVEIISHYESSERVTMMTHNDFLLRNYSCARSDLKEIIWVPFETIKVPIPAEFDHILKDIYGEYMKFPPIEKRGKWHDGIIGFDPDTPYKEYILRLENEDK